MGIQRRRLPNPNEHTVQALGWKSVNLDSKAQIGGYLKKLELGYQAVKSQEEKTEESRIK